MLQQLGLQQLEEVEGETGVGNDPEKGGGQPSVQAHSPLGSHYAAACVKDSLVLCLSDHLEGESGPDRVEGEGGGDRGEPGKAARNKLHGVRLLAKPAKAKTWQQGLEQLERSELEGAVWKHPHLEKTLIMLKILVRVFGFLPFALCCP